MSDFLKKFSNSSYQNMKKIEFPKEEHGNSEEKEINNTVEDNSTNTHLEDTTDLQAERFGKKENFDNEQIEDRKSEVDTQGDLENQSQVALKSVHDVSTTFETADTKEEVYVHDEEKIIKRKKNIIIGILCAIFVIAIVFIGYRKFNEVRVPQFVNEKTLNDVQVWVAKNKLDMTYTSVFSTEVDDGYVVKQSKKEDSKIQKGSTFEIVLSKGADPEQHIKLPDFMKMTMIEIEEWKRKEKANNVTIEKVFNDDIEKSKTIRFEFKTDGIDADNYRRKDKINVVVSKGKEVYEKNIEMPDFKNKSKGEVEAWAKESGVVVEFSEEANNNIMEGNVIAQDVEAKTKVAKKDTVNISISRGKISYVPEFSGLDETQGQVEASKANVAINVVHYYSDSVPANYLISQSIPAGTEIKEQTVSLMYSLGQPYVGNFDGQDVFVMVQSINEMNSQGAWLTYEVSDVSSTEKKGTILTSNYKANFAGVGSHIVISVSSGE